MMRTAIITLALMVGVVYAAAPTKLKVHGIFSSNMVLQRGKPIKVWGWAKPGQAVSVQLGEEKKDATAADKTGRWEAEFPAREASGKPQTLTVVAGEEKAEMTNIVFGDVWVMFGQSNMAWGLQKTSGSDLARLQSNLPMLRHFRIKGNEQLTLQEDIRSEAVVNDGWEVSTPETAPGFSAIGYHFGAILQRSLNIPIGLIQSARGGASSGTRDNGIRPGISCFNNSTNSGST